MKDISVKHSQKTETVDFGPIGRDVILNKKIEDETLRATNKENELEAQITEAGAVKDVKYNGTSIVVDKVAEIKPSIEASVAVETTRATTAETTLQTNINNEATRAQGAEATLTTNLATEVTNRQTGDATLQANITEEAELREETDLILNEMIETEALARSQADATLNSAILRKSTVTVSGSGTSTSQVNYITVDGTEYMLPQPQGGVTNIKDGEYESASVVGALIQKSPAEEVVTWTVDNPHSAFHQATITAGAIGYYSFALNGKSLAEGKRSTSEGTSTIAHGDYSHAEGNQSVAEGLEAHAEGLQSTAKGVASHAEGYLTFAEANSSHAEGFETQALGFASHAEGHGTTALNVCSHAQGLNCAANGQRSFAGGDSSVARGYNDFVFGECLYSRTQASADAGGNTNFVVGKYNSEVDNTLFTVGNGTNENSRSNAFEVYLDGSAKVGKANGSETDLTVATKGYVDAQDANLQDQVNNLKARGRYLSLWNSTTGLPADDPTQLPYTYKAGDYYIIGTVGDGQTLYKPEGSQYTGTASTSVEEREVSVNDVYYFDGTNWAFQSNAQKEVSFSGLAGHPTDNTNLANALNSKVDLSSKQTITGTKTFNTNVNFKDSNYWIGSQPSYGFLTISSGSSNRVRINAASLASYVDNNTNLGNSEESWKNIYFKGELNANGSAGTSGQVLTSNGSGNAPTWQDAPTPSNMVTTNTSQVISSIKYFNDEIRIGSQSYCTSFKHDTMYNIFYIKPTKMSGNKAWINFDSTTTQAIIPTVTNTTPLGDSSKTWSTVYTTNISDGTNSISVANIAVKSTEAAQQVTGQLKICVVTALPASPDPNTLYFIKEA